MAETPLDTLEYTAALLLARRKGKPAQNPKALIGRGNPNRAAVRAIQERLSELGYEISTDGIFGEETEKALRDFQNDKGILVDGVVGKETLGKLTSAKRKESNPADPGLDAVERVVSAGRPQPARRTRGLGRVRANQRAGGSTSAVRAARKAKNKAAGTSGQGGAGGPEKGPHGGIIDPVTGKERATSSTGPIGSTQLKQPNNMSFEEMHPRGEAGTSSGGKFVKKGDSGAQVSQVQRKVSGKGKGKLKIDGKFGPKTEAAVRRYQRKAGITVDGIVGPETRQAFRKR